MSEFVFAIKAAEIPDGGRQLVEVNDQLVLIFRIGQQYFCIDDICTHDGGTLADGEHEGFEIACPRHGAKFDIRTGKALTMPATQPTKVHECRVEGEDVLVRV
ncbi:MAG: non-heme iron oxygenase ferredoxin subunit [Pirellulaceae bacterium]